MKTFARKCSVTGELFNEGYVWYDGAFYTKDEATTATEMRKDLFNGDLLNKYGYAFLKSLDTLSDSDLIVAVCELTNYEIYYTEWEEEDHQYAVDTEGNEIELI
jgi:hypothetical protein